MGIRDKFKDDPLNVIQAALTSFVALGVIVAWFIGWMDELPIWGKITFCCIGITYIAGIAGFLLYRLFPPKITVVGGTERGPFHGKFIKSRDGRHVYFVKHGTRYHLMSWDYAKPHGFSADDLCVVPKDQVSPIPSGSPIKSPAEMAELLFNL